MITFLDGPAAGKTLDLRRAPLLLRVCFNGFGEVVDALDQLNDEPRRRETLVVYRVVTVPAYFHVLARGKGGKALGGWWAMAEYAVLPSADQPSEMTMFDTELWRAWCQDFGPQLCADVIAKGAGHR